MAEPQRYQPGQGGQEQPQTIAVHAPKQQAKRSKRKQTAPESHEPSSVTARRKSGGSRSRKLRVAALALATAAVVAGVFAAGWATANTLVVAQQDRPLPETNVVVLPDSSMSGSSRMPDVRGLSAADAKQAIVDAGIAATAIETEERPAAGAPGRVVQQNPVFGTLDPSLVKIVISTEATVPKTAGRSATEAISELQALGARVTQQRVYEPGVTVGEAIRTEPAAGERLSENVTLFIADSPSERSLEEFDTIGSRASWSSNGELFAGKQVDAIASFYADRPDNVSDYAWKLGGRVTSIEGSYAIDEGQDPAFGGSFVVLADGKEIARLTAKSAVSDFDLDVRGVQTLVIRAVRSLPDESGTLVLIDPVALGSFDDLAKQP